MNSNGEEKTKNLSYKVRVVLDDCQTPLDKNNLKPENFRACDQPEKIVGFGVPKASKILQTEQCQPKTIENKKNLTFIRTFNPNNPKIFDFLKSGLD